MREMGYAVARKHAGKLRRVVMLSLFAAPLTLCLLAALLGGGSATLALVLATLSASIGVVTERWLFFAEAEHVVMTFYAAKAA